MSLRLITNSIFVCMLLGSLLSIWNCKTEIPPKKAVLEGRLLIRWGRAVNLNPSGYNVEPANLLEFTRNTETEEIQLKNILQNILDMEISPDNNYLVYTKNQKLFLRNLINGEDREIDSIRCRCMSWALDSSKFSCTYGSWLYVYDLDGKKQTIIEPRGELYKMEKCSTCKPIYLVSDVGCAKWIATNRLVFKRFTGKFPAKMGANATSMPVNTTTLATLEKKIEMTDYSENFEVIDTCLNKSRFLVESNFKKKLIKSIPDLEALEGVDLSEPNLLDNRNYKFKFGNCSLYGLRHETSTEYNKYENNKKQASAPKYKDVIYFIDTETFNVTNFSFGAQTTNGNTKFRDDKIEDVFLHPDGKIAAFTYQSSDGRCGVDIVDMETRAETKVWKDSHYKDFNLKVIGWLK